MVTLDDARKIIAAAEKRAKELRQPMNIAVADGGGNLVAHARSEAARPLRRDWYSGTRLPAKSSKPDATCSSSK